jgi:hypothetical protein
VPLLRGATPSGLLDGATNAPRRVEFATPRDSNVTSISAKLQK